jgi:hypothetical protein
MNFSNPTNCPLCHGIINPSETWCGHCGRTVQALNPLPREPYMIFPDGVFYGIKLRDEIKIDGLDLRNAEIALDALNGM